MVVKTVIGRELYVYMNGELLYKRWLDQGHGIILQSNGWGNFRAKDVWQHVTTKSLNINENRNSKTDF